MSIFSDSINAIIGDRVALQRQDVEVEQCDGCGHSMVNLDADELRPGDLILLKRKGIWLSNPETEELTCAHCEFNEPNTFGRAISTWFEDDNSDDDSSFFSRGSFGGSSGFGGFGGGSFGGGGAGRAF